MCSYVYRRGWHGFESETVDIRLGAFPIPLPPLIYCLSWTCVSLLGLLWERVAFFIIFQPRGHEWLFPRRIWGKVFYDVVTCCTSRVFFPSPSRFYASSSKFTIFRVVPPVKTATLANEIRIKLSQMDFCRNADLFEMRDNDFQIFIFFPNMHRSWKFLVTTQLFENLEYALIFRSFDISDNTSLI